MDPEPLFLETIYDLNKRLQHPGREYEAMQVALLLRRYKRLIR
jgi:hypothetical protein